MPWYELRWIGRSGFSPHLLISSYYYDVGKLITAIQPIIVASRLSFHAKPFALFSSNLSDRICWVVRWKEKAFKDAVHRALVFLFCRFTRVCAKQNLNLDIKVIQTLDPILSGEACMPELLCNQNQREMHSTSLYRISEQCWPICQGEISLPVARAEGNTWRCVAPPNNLRSSRTDWSGPWVLPRRGWGDGHIKQLKTLFAVCAFTIDKQRENGPGCWKCIMGVMGCWILDFKVRCERRPVQSWGREPSTISTPLCALMIYSYLSKLKLLQYIWMTLPSRYIELNPTISRSRLRSLGSSSMIGKGMLMNKALF